MMVSIGLLLRYGELMDRDTAKLQGIARDLSQLGLEMSNRNSPPDEEFCTRVGEAFVALSEAIEDICAALERGARQAQ